MNLESNDASLQVIKIVGIIHKYTNQIYSFGASMAGLPHQDYTLDSVETKNGVLVLHMSKSGSNKDYLVFDHDHVYIPIIEQEGEDTNDL